MLKLGLRLVAAGTVFLAACNSDSNSDECHAGTFSSPGGGQVVMTGGSFDANSFPILVLGNPPNTQAFPMSKDGSGNWYSNTGLPSGTYKASLTFSGGSCGEKNASGVPVNGIRVNN
jgi:hypothetical protein